MSRKFQGTSNQVWRNASVGETLYESGLGPAPWSHLECLATIGHEGPFRVQLYSCNCGYGNYLIDLQIADLVPPTIALIRSHDLDDVIELLENTRLGITRYEYCDD